MQNGFEDCALRINPLDILVTRWLGDLVFRTSLTFTVGSPPLSRKGSAHVSARLYRLGPYL